MIWPGLRPATLPPPGMNTAGDSFPTLAENLPGHLGNSTGKPSRKRRPPDRQLSAHRALGLALRQAKRPMTVTELSVAMGCCVGEASKRVKAARSIVRTKKVGRYKMVSLKQMTLTEWRALFGRTS